MKLALALVAIAGVGGPARAAPCRVTLEHAPDDVRAVVEAWLAQEPRCDIALEARIVPTSDGLYVFARDERGSVRERVVPDAQSAAALITSWTVDDTEPAPMSVELSYVPAPAMTDGIDRGIRLPARHHGPQKTFAVLALASPHVRGVRAELDVWRHGPWRAGAIASVSRDRYFDYENRGYDDVDFLDMKAMASFAAVGEAGRWHLTWGIAAGAVASYLRATDYFYPWNGAAYGSVRVLGVAPIGEVSIVGGVRFADWIVEAGPIATGYVQEYESPTLMGHTTIEARGGELLVLAGARHPL